MPIIKGAIELGVKGDDSARLRGVRSLEQQQFHRLPVFRKKAKIYPIFIHSGSQGGGLTRAQVSRARKLGRKSHTTTGRPKKLFLLRLSKPAAIGTNSEQNL